MGDAVDRGPAGRYQGVYQEKRRVYREYRLGGEGCARVGRHLCARPEGVVFRLLLVVVASRSHQTEETTAFIDNLRKQGKPVTLISSGSSLKICLVAEGSADIYPRFAPTMEWDTAAGHAIAKSAGCDIYHIDGKTPLRYNKEDLHNPWFIVK